MTDPALRPDPEQGSFRHYVRRIGGFIWGDQDAAEDLDQSPNPSVVEWMQQADEDVVDYAREVSKAGFERADEALKGLQSKAGTTVTTVLTLAPIAFGVTGVALASTGEPDAAKWVGFVLFCLVDVSLVGAGLLAFLASGLVLSGGVNPANLPTRAPNQKVHGLKAAEADAWYYAMVVTNWSGKRVATDLFHSRRLVIGSLLLSALAVPFVALGL